MIDKNTFDAIVESIYAQAVERSDELVSEGGIPAEEKWWWAIEQAFKEGYEMGKNETV